MKDVFNIAISEGIYQPPNPKRGWVDGEGLCYGDRKGVDGFSLGIMWPLAPIRALHITRRFRNANPLAVIQPENPGRDSFIPGELTFTFAI